MKSEIEAKIERQDVIGEANPGGYQPVRFTRVKYKASPHPHIDIRRFQRGYDDEGEEAWFPTKMGFRFPERNSDASSRIRAVPRRMSIRTSWRRASLLNAKQFECRPSRFQGIETTVRASSTPPRRWGETPPESLSS